VSEITLAQLAQTAVAAKQLQLPAHILVADSDGQFEVRGACAGMRAQRRCGSGDQTGQVGKDQQQGGGKNDHAGLAQLDGVEHGGWPFCFLRRVVTALQHYAVVTPRLGVVKHAVPAKPGDNAYNQRPAVMLQVAFFNCRGMLGIAIDDFITTTSGLATRSYDVTPADLKQPLS